jgi:hypothetical protein
MFGQAKPVVIDRYGQRRRRPVPRWLVLLIVGVIAGAGGVVFVQERYLPPRLSTAETARLRQSYEQADSERRALKRDLDDATRRLDAALSDTKRLTADLASSREAGAHLQQLASSMVESLPPDPRGGAVEVRAARFTLDGAALAYDVVLTRGRGGSKPMPAVMQLTVTGASARGDDSRAALKPVSITMGAFESLRGSLPLPEGFVPRQAMVQVLDHADGKVLGMRVMLVK